MNVCPVCRRALSDDVCPIDAIESVEVPDHLVPPEIAEEFGIKGVYGAGDMGALYHVYDGYSASWGLLKIMKLSEGASDAGRQRLARDLDRQLQLAGSARLSLARRAKVEGDRAWVFRPWIDGESLESRLFREDQLGLVLAMGIVAKIAVALDELHRAGLVHGSLHPGHVILIPSEDEIPDVALIDAGIVGDAQRGSAFDDLGDLFYMSPEQIKGKAWGFRSDLYALGCTFYEMITGEPPFDGDTAEGVMAAHQYQVPSIPDDLLPSSVAQLLARLLAKVPSDRPMSTREIISTLTPYVGEIEPRTSSHPPPARSSAARVSSLPPPAPAPRASSVPPPAPAARPSSAPPPAPTARASSGPPAPKSATPRTTSSAPPPAMSLAEIAARSRATQAPAVTTLPEPMADAANAPRHRKRRDPSSIQILVSDFADVAERTGSFVIQKTARLPWLSLGILIGVLTTAGTAYAMAMGGQFHVITHAMESYLAVPGENLDVGSQRTEVAPDPEPSAQQQAIEPVPEREPSALASTEPDAESQIAEPVATPEAEAEEAPDEAAEAEEEEAAEAEEAEAEEAAAARARRQRIRQRRIRRRRARRRAAARMRAASRADGLADGLAL